MPCMSDEASINLARVTLTILVRHPEQLIPFYLMCIDALDYPKHLIALYVRAIHQTDQTTDILGNWVDRVQHRYLQVDFDCRISGDDPDRAICEARRQSMQFG